MANISENEVEKMNNLEDKIKWLWQYGVESPTAREYFQAVVDALRSAQSAPVDLERVQKTLVLLFPFDRMEHTEAQKTMELMESMGLVFMRETDSDFEEEEYGDYVWLLTEKGRALLPPKESK